MKYLIWLLLPIWIFITSFLLNKLLEFCTRNRYWFEFPLWMSIGLPFGLGSIVIAIFIIILPLMNLFSPHIH